MSKKIIKTDHAPAAIGTYSQAVKVNNTVYLSGQIGLDPVSMQLLEGIENQIHRVFQNLQAVATAADGKRRRRSTRATAVGRCSTNSAKLSA